MCLKCTLIVCLNFITQFTE